MMIKALNSTRLQQDCLAFAAEGEQARASSESGLLVQTPPVPLCDIMTVTGPENSPSCGYRNRNQTQLGLAGIP
eukprot:3132117-Rhodomonas_salina.1